jgi:hypothetical protein
LRTNWQVTARARRGICESSAAKLVLDRHPLPEYFFTRAT